MNVDSLGLKGYYKRLYDKLGITMSKETETYFQQHDRKRKLDRDYAKTVERKKKRAKRKLDQIQSAWKSEAEDKQQGHTYQSCKAVPTVTGTEAATNGGVVGAIIPCCNTCGNYGHQRRTSKKCTHNPRNKDYYQGTYID
jgi:hypothetical protein